MARPAVRVLIASKLRLSHLLAVWAFVACASFQSVAQGSTADLASHALYEACDGQSDDLDGAKYASLQARDDDEPPPCELGAPEFEDGEDDANPYPRSQLVVLTVSFGPLLPLPCHALRGGDVAYTAQFLVSSVLARGPPCPRC